MTVYSDDQPSVFVISETDTPLSKAIETAVALVEWAENLSDTPTSFRTSMQQWLRLQDDAV